MVFLKSIDNNRFKQRTRKVHCMDHRSQLLINANFVCVRQSKAKMYRIELSADVCRLPKHVLLINTINI